MRPFRFTIRFQVRHQHVESLSKSAAVIGRVAPNVLTKLVADPCQPRKGGQVEQAVVKRKGPFEFGGLVAISIELFSNPCLGIGKNLASDVFFSSKQSVPSSLSSVPRTVIVHRTFFVLAKRAIFEPILIFIKPSLQILLVVGRPS